MPGMEDSGAPAVLNASLVASHLPTEDVEMASRWLYLKRNNPHTLRAYRRELQALFTWMANQELTLRQLLDVHLSAYLEQLTAARAIASNNSQRQIIAILRSLFAYLQKQRYLDRNPLDEVRRPEPVNHAISNFLGDDECALVYQYLDTLDPEDDQARAHVRQRWLFSLAYLTGMRRAEMATARMADVHEARSRRGRALWLSVLGKGNKRRKVPVSEQLEVELARYRAALGLPALPSAHEEYGLVMPVRGPNGTTHKASISPTRIYEIIKELLLAVADYAEPHQLADTHSLDKLRHASTHWLRHSHASALIEHADIRLVQRQLGHARIETTEIYLHDDADKRLAAINKLAIPTTGK